MKRILLFLLCLIAVESPATSTVQTPILNLLLQSNANGAGQTFSNLVGLQITGGSAGQFLGWGTGGYVTWLTPTGGGATNGIQQLNGVGTNTALATPTITGGAIDTTSTIASVTAANIAAGATLANAATSANTPSALVKRGSDGSASMNGYAITNLQNAKLVTDYGTVGTSDDTTVFQSAIYSSAAANVELIIPTGNYIVGNLVATNGLRLTGYGATLTLKSGVTNYLLNTTNVSPYSISGLIFEGSDYSDAGTRTFGTRHGLYVNETSTNSFVFNCTFKGFGGYGMAVSGTLPGSGAGQTVLNAPRVHLDSCTFWSNCIGSISFSKDNNNVGEYINFNDFQYFGNHIGIMNAAGNVYYTTPLVTENYEGVYVEGGGPNANHSTITGGKLNHNIHHDLLCSNVLQGFKIIGADFEAPAGSGSQLYNSHAIFIVACKFGNSMGIEGEGGSGNFITDCFYTGAYKSGFLAYSFTDATNEFTLTGNKSFDTFGDTDGSTPWSISTPANSVLVGIAFAENSPYPANIPATWTNSPSLANLTLSSLTAKTIVAADAGKKLVSVPAGTDGQILVQDSSQASGMKWSNAPTSGGGGSGTVTSVAATVPSWLTVSGSPITTSGTLAVTATTGQAANKFIASPDGATGAVSLRSMANNDIASLAFPAGNITGTVNPVNLGSGTQDVHHYLNGFQEYSQIDLGSDITSTLLPDANVSTHTLLVNASTNTLTGGLNVTGGVSANNFTGNGAGMTSLPAPNLTGTQASGTESVNTMLLTGNQTVAGNKTFTGIQAVTNSISTNGVTLESGTDAINVSSNGTGVFRVLTNGQALGNFFGTTNGTTSIVTVGSGTSETTGTESLRLTCGAGINLATYTFNNFNLNMGGKAIGSASSIAATSTITGAGGFIGLSTAPTVVSVGGSPYTYTAGTTDETVAIGGGTVSSIVWNGTTIPSAFLTLGYSSKLAGGKSVVVTYTVAPSMVSTK